MTFQSAQACLTSALGVGVGTEVAQPRGGLREGREKRKMKRED